MLPCNEQVSYSGCVPASQPVFPRSTSTKSLKRIKHLRNMNEWMKDEMTQKFSTDTEMRTSHPCWNPQRTLPPRLHHGLQTWLSRTTIPNTSPHLTFSLTWILMRLTKPFLMCLISCFVFCFYLALLPGFCLVDCLCISVFVVCWSPDFLFWICLPVSLNF